MTLSLADAPALASTAALSPRRLLRLSGAGKLLVCTDLQGNLQDFLELVRRFRAVMAREPDSHLLVTGDLVHGPEYTEAEWPDYLGAYYLDDSPGVLRAFEAVAEAFPGRIHALLGNHEHAHVGGPVVSKFFLDEAAYLEGKLGPVGTLWMRNMVASWPVAAASSCGVIFTHGAPAARITGPEDFDDLAGPKASPGSADVSGYEQVPLWRMIESGVLGALLWSRGASEQQAASFLDALGGRIGVYGHDIVREGFLKIGKRQLCLSTSFGLADERKTYLELDLGRHYESVDELEEGRELKRLYP